MDYEATLVLVRTTAHLLDDRLLLVKALFGSGLGDAAGGTAELSGHLLALGLGRELLDSFPAGVADLLGPLSALLLCGVALSHVLTLLLL